MLFRSLANKDYHGIANLFLQDGYWRDHLALSWDLRTLKGGSDILAFLDKNCPLDTVRLDTSSAFRAPVFGPIDGWGDVKGVQFFITFDTNIGNGQGVVRLAEEDGQWRIFTLFTSLRELKGYEEPVNNRRTKGVEHGVYPDRNNWADGRRAEANFEDKNPAVIIIGKGSPRSNHLELCRYKIDCRSRPGRSNSRRAPQNAGCRRSDNRQRGSHWRQLASEISSTCAS